MERVYPPYTATGFAPVANCTSWAACYIAEQCRRPQACPPTEKLIPQATEQQALPSQIPSPRKPVHDLSEPATYDLQTLIGYASLL